MITPQIAGDLSVGDLSTDAFSSIVAVADSRGTTAHRTLSITVG